MNDITKREDRIGMYLVHKLKPYVFAEFSEEYIKKIKAPDSIKGVPIPLRKEDLQKFAGGAGVSGNIIAENMAFVMGCDPKFKYTTQYREFLLKVFNYKIYEGMLKKGRDAAENEDFIYACIQFRATLVMKPDYLHGMYSYARVCREMYMGSDDPEYVGRFKAESLEFFELITEIHPRFAQSYYYLGYAYLNMGLYGKANAAWRMFLKKSRNSKDVKEIKERLNQIKEPMEIEEGCNLVLRGSYSQGKEVLEKYLDSQFKTWWPLHYYLGVIYSQEGKEKEAITSFETVLSKNPAHLETMEELVAIYSTLENKEKAEKYKKKIEIVKRDLVSIEESRETSLEKKRGKSLDTNKIVEEKAESKITAAEKNKENKKESKEKRFKKLN